eukprot:scaffold11222_cov56-Attheya_sp.AAC.2
MISDVQAFVKNTETNAAPGLTKGQADRRKGHSKCYSRSLTIGNDPIEVLHQGSSAAVNISR